MSVDSARILAMPEQPHIVILGAGPGGCIAAIRAAQVEARVSVAAGEAIRQLRRKAG